MALAAKLYQLDNRTSDRFDVEVDATVRANAAHPIDATVIDLSETGFCAWIAQDLPIGAEISIGLPGVGVIEACVVRRDGEEYGAEFRVPITAAAIARATHTETVVAFPDTIAQGFADLGPAPAPVDDPHEKLPRLASLGIILGSSALLWAGIIGGVRAVVA